MFQILLLAACLSVAAIFAQAPSAPSVSKTHLMRAKLLEEQGQIDQAEAEFKAAIETASKSLNTSELVRALDHACTYYQDIGRVPQAESCLKRLFTTFQQKIGVEHITLNRVMNRLACLYIEIGQRGKAERLGIPAWLERLEQEDPMSHDRIDLTGTMAALEIMRGNPARAAALNTTAWEILEKLGETSTNSGITVLNNLAIAYMELKKYKEAAAVLERALALGETAGFRGTLTLAATHANMAKVYEDLKMLPKAERHMAVALEVIELRCGRESTRTGAILASYANLLKKMGRKDEARTASTRAKRIGETSGIASFTGHSVDISDMLRGGRR
jgi:tetratricopeptide (TPR) repeat protein